jgi:hypothetical protein
MRMMPSPKNSKQNPDFSVTNPGEEFKTSHDLMNEAIKISDTIFYKD